jgi:predicted aspartyl protease
MEDMGTFRITIEIENVQARGPRRSLEKTLVDTGAELTWAPRAVLESLGIQRQKTIRFWMADGRAVERDVGDAIVHAAGAETNDEVVFAEPGDLILLGARSLEGMNLRVDPREKRLVAEDRWTPRPRDDTDRPRWRYATLSVSRRPLLHLLDQSHHLRRLEQLIALARTRRLQHPCLAQVSQRPRHR